MGQKEEKIGFEIAAEYQWNEDTVFARLMADRSEMDLMVGIRRQLDEESSIDVVISNKDTLNVRYGVDNGSGLSGFIAAFIHLKDPRDRAKLQYGVFMES